MPFKMLLALCDTDTDANGTMSHQHQWHHEMPMEMAMVPHNQKSHVAPYVNCLDVMECSGIWQCWWHHVMLISVPMTWPEKPCCTSFQSSWLNKCNGATRNAIIITGFSCVAMAALDQKSCCISFQSLDIRNALMMPSASCDTDSSTSGITWLSCTSFQLSWPKEWHDVIFNIIGTMWCQHCCQWYDMNKESWFTSLWVLWAKTVMVPWQQHWHLSDMSRHCLDMSRYKKTCLVM